MSGNSVFLLYNRRISPCVEGTNETPARFRLDFAPCGCSVRLARHIIRVETIEFAIENVCFLRNNQCHVAGARQSRVANDGLYYDAHVEKVSHQEAQACQHCTVASELLLLLLLLQLLKQLRVIEWNIYIY